MEKSVTPENVVDSDLCECGKPFWDYVHNLPEGRDDFNNHEFRPAGVGGREESPWREIACEIAGRHIIIRVEDIEQAIALAVEKSAIWYSGYPPSKHAVETIREFMLAELLEQKENESRVGRTVVPEESARQTMERNGQKSPKTLR